MIDTWLKFVKGHEKILLIVAAALLLWWGYGRYVDYADKHATAQEQISLAAAQQQQLVVAQLTQQYSQLLAQNAADRAAFMQAIAARDAALAKQKQADQTAPLPDVARRIATLATFDPAWIAVAPGGGITMTEPAARATASTLEDVPVLQQNLKDTTAMLTGEQAANAQCNALVAAQVTEIAKNKKAADDVLAQQKADARKAKRSWFVRGAVVGAAVVGYLLRSKF